MAHETPGNIAGLPENARRPLKEGESYVPVMPGDGIPEVTVRSVLLGLAFCALFAMAAAYVALKLGQGIEAAIPIAILGIGISSMMPRKSTMLENVIVQSIGANSSHVVSGAVFTIPALFMLAAEPGSGVPEPSLFQIVTVSFLGGCLGVLFLIPLRHHLIVEMHGQFPWPEGTATTEIILTGERAGGQAKTLVIAAGAGALYDGLVTTFKVMTEELHLKALYVSDLLDRFFMQFSLLNNAAIMGVGYIIGPRYAAIICAGSFMSVFLLVPIVYSIGQFVPEAIAPGTIPIAEMNQNEVFRSYVRIIGVGGIAGAGILGIIGSLPSMVRSIGANLQGMKSQDTRDASAVPRTDQSLSGTFVIAGLALFIVAALAFFSFGLGLADSFKYAMAGTAVVTIIAFFFAPVAARAIAIVGTNPVSGMTMLTLIITGFVLLKMGLTGGMGMFVTMLVGGVVCTALAASGALASDLKIGHWIGATPSRQLGLKFLGTFVAALFCGIAMWLFSQQDVTFGSQALPAPQASAMKEILVGIFGTTAQPLQWYLFSLGVIFAVVLRIIGVPALAFALGMYLPIELNTPVLFGGILSWVVGRPWGGASPAKVKAGQQKGILIASGLIAGGALWGVFDAALAAFAFGGDTGAKTETLGVFSEHFLAGRAGEAVSLLALIGLAAFIIFYARSAKEEDA